MRSRSVGAAPLPPTFKDRYSEKYEFKAQAVFIDRDASGQASSREGRRGDGPGLGDRHEDMVSSLQVRKSNYYYTAAWALRRRQASPFFLAGR